MRSWQVVIPALLVAFNASAQQASTAQSLPSINLEGSKATGGNTAKSGNTAKGGNTASPSADSTMADLVSRGYEIKAAVPNGGKFVVFMQKDQSAYACEFSSLTDTRCGSLN